MKRHILLFAFLLCSAGRIGAQDSGSNWIKTRTAISETGTTITDITYYNGLGLPSQTTNVRASVNGYNIVTPIAGTTRDSILTRYNRFGMDFYLIDTTGLRKKTKVTDDLEFYSVLRSIRSIESSDVCILMIDASAGVEAQDMNIFRLIERNKKGCVIVINKWDLVEKGSNTMKEYAESIRRRIAPFDDVPIVFTSVLNKQRILDVLQTAMNVYYARIRRIPTSALNEYLLLLKSDHFDKMGDQEFLDRENNWSLIFFLDNNHNWIRTHIVVNDWIVRINDAEL